MYNCVVSDCSHAGFLLATRAGVLRLHPMGGFPYNQTMKQSVFLQSTRLFTRALIFILCLALFAGCSFAPDSDSGDILTDEDANAPDAAVVTETIPPERDIAIVQQPIDTLLANRDLAILFVNVGKADAAILRFGDTAFLIDTGSAESAPQLIAGLNALGIEQISAVFITHSHSDHLGGLDALSANYDIPIVYSPFYAESDKNGKGKIVKRAEKLALPHQELMAGDVMTVTDDVTFTVLGPLSLNETDDNDNSLVLRFDYGGKSFLFVGDMQFAEEQEIIASGAALKSDVLKVGNHGNPDATGDDFGMLVSPALAVISTNTTVDKDSANPRVYAALPDAQIVVTQDFPLGVLLTLDNSGEIALGNPAREPVERSVIVSGFDVSSQTITLTTSDTNAADLSGMILFSVRSDALLRFPDGTMLNNGESLVIGEGGDFTFKGEDKPLSKKKDNTVILYDRFGALISKLEQ